MSESHKWLLALKVWAFALTRLLGCALLIGPVNAATPPTVDDYVVVYNAGGFPNGWPARGWKAFFREADEFDFVMIHNPGGHYMVPMQFQQLSYAAERLPNNPRTDWEEFSAAGEGRIKWWSVYIGHPRTMPAIEGEKDHQRADRAFREILPIIKAQPDLLIFDALLETERWVELLIAKIEFYGVRVGFEPARYRDQADMAGMPACLLTNYWSSRTNPKSVHGWDTGKNAARPLTPVNEQPLVLRIVDGKNPIAEFAEARSVGHVPAIKKNHMKRAEGLR